MACFICNKTPDFTAKWLGGGHYNCANFCKECFDKNLAKYNTQVGTTFVFEDIKKATAD